MKKENEEEKNEKTEIIEYVLELSEERHPKIMQERTLYSSEETFMNPAAIDVFFRSALRLDRQYEELIYMVAMNAKGTVTALFEIGHGTMTKTFCGAKELAVRMLLSGACNVIVVHNHPSGNVTPSIEDERMAERISEIASLLDIQLLDFIIIGTEYYSFAEQGKLENAERRIW